jgi:alpha-beta hydrolase superfamily lysophospholipase
MSHELAGSWRHVAPGGRGEVVLRDPSSGEEIVERAVHLGPSGLFGIVSEPRSGTAPGPVVTFLNAGLLHHVGPARLWVELARRFAGAGMRTVRFDLSGLGDSPVRPGQRAHFSYPKEAIDDIAEVLDELTNGDRHDSVLVGLCAGAYHAIEGGIALRVRGICAINPILHFDPPDLWSDPSGHSERQVLQPYSPWIKRLRRFDGLVRFGEHRAPPVVWWTLDKLGLQPHPAHALEQLAQRDVDSLLICGDVEARPFQRRAKWAMRDLARGGRVRFEVLSGTDHTLFGASARARATSLIAGHVLTSFAPHPAAATARAGTRSPR